jgi:hypothetical protein
VENRANDEVGERLPIERIVVAVPGRDERDRIARCLRTIDRAAACSGLPVHLVVAADSCTDDSAETARRVDLHHCALQVLEGEWGRAGGARRAAVAAGLAPALLHREPGAVWIANTDADSQVPEHWLRDQVRLAARCDALAGIVELDPERVPASLLHRFRAHYRLDGDRHAHVHGANLGVRADAYLAAGGWCPDTVVGEDHGLWSRIAASGATTLHSTALRVTTSARTTSRVVGGFATTLTAIGSDGTDPLSQTGATAREELVA